VFYRRKTPKIPISRRFRRIEKLRGEERRMKTPSSQKQTRNFQKKLGKFFEFNV